jgi:hypothetical protein
MHNFTKPPVKVTNSGVGFAGLLTLLFVALKLTGCIQWPWYWVVSPLLIQMALGLVIVAVAALAVVVVEMLEKKSTSKK